MALLSGSTPSDSERIAHNSRPEARVSIYSDSSDSPGKSLHILENPRTIDSSKLTFKDFTPREEVLLTAYTSYWVVVEPTSENPMYLATTESTAEDVGGERGWSIANNFYESFSSETFEENPFTRMSVQMAVLGTLHIPDSQRSVSEGDGEDLPGRHDQMTTTPGRLNPWQPVNGDLTAPMDRNHGFTGDYYRLVTEPNRKYRVQVWFGDSPTRDTGGAVELAFARPGGFQSGFSPGHDHNREDGLTIIEVPDGEPTATWYIRVTSYDMFNPPMTRTYNGPYRVEMTEITDVKARVENLLVTPEATDSFRVGTYSGATYTVATSFTTGTHSNGYSLDHILIQTIPSTAPAIHAYSYTWTQPVARVKAQSAI